MSDGEAVILGILIIEIILILAILGPVAMRHLNSLVEFEESKRETEESFKLWVGRKINESRRNDE